MPDANFVEKPAANNRKYYLVMPDNYDPNRRYPVMLAYHGWFTDSPSFRGFLKVEKFIAANNAERTRDAFVIYPETSSPPNAFWDVNTDMDYTMDVINRLGADYCINPSKVFGYGHSLGGKFMNDLGCRKAGYIKAIGIANGSDGTGNNNCGRLPVLFTHRPRDPDERIEWARAAFSRWKGLNECTGGPRPAAIGNGCEELFGCKEPGGGTFCSETWDGLKDIPGYQPNWEHAPQPNYVKLAWDWFAALP
jgi:poly(3-hydroxybutyrate) depolymerase